MEQGTFSRLEAMQTTMHNNGSFLVYARHFELTSIELEVFLSKSNAHFFPSSDISCGTGRCIRSAEAVIFSATFFYQGNAEPG
jgi:hypothetical protein